ncbi:MAG: HD domain-containing phosphohydrolase [Holophaga sp.]|jgi:HD-GYP domain-containing protein (c-di-GMP phosphodiesterase class II)
MHRSSLRARLGHEAGKVLDWADAGPADVVLGMDGEGWLSGCASWPGVEAAAALVQAGFERWKDRRSMDRLNEIGRALASEQDLGRLLDLILTHGRRLVQAEAGSIYQAEAGPDGPELVFAHAQNAKVDLPYRRTRKRVSADWMAGFVAMTGATLNLPDVYRLPEDTPYSFDSTFDQKTGYRSTSMLVVPLTDNEGQVIGVLQFINRLEEDAAGSRAVPFGPEQERLALSLAGQAGVAMRNARFLKEKEELFEKFVNASVTAIEQRDPVTSGHSGRVAKLTVGLAEAVNRVGTGPFGGTFFSDQQLRELRYASLLHDFGKVGVREEVLVKAKKLPGIRLELLLQRLRQRQGEAVLARVRRDWEQGREFDPELWGALLRDQEAETRALMELLVRSNEPTVLTQEVAAGLEAMEGLSYTQWDGGTSSVLDPGDLAYLTIRRGSLSESERVEIESHVTHTFNFLGKIPWTSDLAAVPAIAYAHHERLNGQGYPRRLTAPDIPMQSRAMAIADIFDALTAQDRPYKAAVTLARSLDILQQDARSGHLDPDLLGIFIEARVFERTVESGAAPI